MNWGGHNLVGGKTPVSRLKLFQLRHDKSPHLFVTGRPGHGSFALVLKFSFHQGKANTPTPLKYRVKGFWAVDP